MPRMPLLVEFQSLPRWLRFSCSLKHSSGSWCYSLLVPREFGRSRSICYPDFSVECIGSGPLPGSILFSWFSGRDGCATVLCTVCLFFQVDFRRFDSNCKHLSLWRVVLEEHLVLSSKMHCSWQELDQLRSSIDQDIAYLFVLRRIPRYFSNLGHTFIQQQLIFRLLPESTVPWDPWLTLDWVPYTTYLSIRHSCDRQHISISASSFCYHTFLWRLWASRPLL